MVNVFVNNTIKLWILTIIVSVAVSRTILILTMMVVKVA